MKIAISYPPLESDKGTPCLAQNRQFQWFNNPTYIYPVIPAYAATLLKNNGYEVFWDDGIAEGLSYADWKERIIKEKPDIIAIETKTPVVKKHREIINELKNSKFEIRNSKFVLMGDHVSALPEESLRNSEADYIIASGDYDFMLLNLANHLAKGEKLEGGFYFRDNGKILNSGPADLSKHDLNSLPFIDRKLTKWKLYAHKNGNFKITPGAYLMSARDCWWGKCSFCSWAALFPGEKFRKMNSEKALDEVGNLIALGAKEIMEDSGTLPIGEWLENFCQGMIKRGYNQKIKINCNMRLNAIKNAEIWKLMKKAGFRMVLFGMESVNQETLNRINKNLNVSEIESGLKLCKQAGLEPHIAAMIGYPWETKEQAQKTIDLTKNLFKKGLIDTLQGTIVVPYPGTPLYEYALENDLLITKDYDRFDQRELVLKSSLTSRDAKKLVRNLYFSFASPRFMARKIFSIRSFKDIKYLLLAGKKWLGHLVDFS